MSVVILRQVENSLIQVLDLDATISEQITHNGTVTEHPIEDGSLVADHIQLDPVTLSVTGFVSNTPVSLGLGAIPRSDPTRARTAYEALLEVFRKKELVQIQDGLDVYEDMAMTSLSVPRDRASANALQFTAAFRKLTKVGTQTVEIASDDQEIAAPSEDIGKQTPTEATEEVEQESSLLYQAYEGARGLF